MFTPGKMFKIAAWCMIAFGFIHEASFVYTYFTTSNTEAFLVSMTAFHIDGTGTNLYSFYGGYGILMGILLIGLGILDIKLATAAGPSILTNGGVMFTNIIIALLALAVSIVYFVFVIPIALTGLASLFFIMAYAKAK